MYFKKFNLKLPNLDISRLKGTYVEGYGPTFKAYDIKDTDYVNNLIAGKIKFHIPPAIKCFIEISDDGATPHTDRYSVALNYYIDSANSLTMFWAPKPNVSSWLVDRILEDGSLDLTAVREWNSEDLNLMCTFKAKSNELFLLDTKKIHSIAKFEKSSFRTMLSWRWFIEDYETILNSIEIID